MKQKATLLLTAMLVLLASPAFVLGQQRKITETEFKRLIANAAEKRKGTPQRQIVKTTGYNPGDSSETLYTFGPNDAFHMVSIRKRNGVETKSEVIRIGSVRYSRQADGKWQKEEPHPAKVQGGAGYGSGGASVASGPPEVESDYRYLGKERVGGEKADHYKMTKRVTFKLKTGPSVRLVTEEYWFRDDGMLLKEIKEDAFSNRRYRSVTEYVYDNTIEIKAPID